jgi:hypothetical protein
MQEEEEWDAIYRLVKEVCVAASAQNKKQIEY